MPGLANKIFYQYGYGAQLVPQYLRAQIVFFELYSHPHLKKCKEGGVVMEKTSKKLIPTMGAFIVEDARSSRVIIPLAGLNW